MIDHLSLAVSDYEQSKLFYQSVLAPLGYTLPGLRSEYHPTYYGAFVLDPDGNNIEAVCHLPE